MYNGEHGDDGKVVAPMFHTVPHRSRKRGGSDVCHIYNYKWPGCNHIKVYLSSIQHSNLDLTYDIAIERGKFISILIWGLCS